MRRLAMTNGGGTTLPRNDEEGGGCRSRFTPSQGRKIKTTALTENPVYDLL